MKKLRSPGNTQISISIEADLVAEIDARAASLGQSRSSYLAHLAKRDISVGGPIAPAPAAKVEYGIRPASAALNDAPEAPRKKSSGGKPRKAGPRD